MSRSRQTPISRQGGWLMPVAAFIIVVMGLLAAGMLRVGSQTSVASVQEGISLQAFYAAESGAQHAMSRITFDSGGDPVAGGTECAGVNGSSLNLDAAGMRNCQVSLTCTQQAGAAKTVFQIESAATCGAPPVTASRTVRVSAYLQ